MDKLVKKHKRFHIGSSMDESSEIMLPRISNKIFIDNIGR